MVKGECYMWLDLVNSKYTKLMERIYQLGTDNSEESLNKVIDLANSIHKDEVELLVRMNEMQKEREAIHSMSRELAIPSFMVRN